MATRPVFFPTPRGHRLVDVRSYDFAWHGGFALAQRRKNIAGLHGAAARAGALLEVSRASPVALGVELSAFNLKVDVAGLGPVPLECVFQGAKVFSKGGPFSDLFAAAPAEAKKDPRLGASGPLVRFELQGDPWPLEPKTAFYDWLYLRAVQPLTGVVQSLASFDGFTDIAFNPARSINCQARSCALLVALARRGQLEAALRSKESFLAVLSASAGAGV